MIKQSYLFPILGSDRSLPPRWEEFQPYKILSARLTANIAKISGISKLAKCDQHSAVQAMEASRNVKSTTTSGKKKSLISRKFPDNFMFKQLTFKHRRRNSTYIVPN